MQSILRMWLNISRDVRKNDQRRCKYNQHEAGKWGMLHFMSACGRHSGKRKDTLNFPTRLFGFCPNTVVELTRAAR